MNFIIKSSKNIKKMKWVQNFFFHIILHVIINLKIAELENIRMGETYRK